ncbi:MAG: hypothetical protein ACW98U_14990 [Candidatus Thorarchaeota archaeon]
MDIPIGMTLNPGVLILIALFVWYYTYWKRNKTKQEMEESLNE